MKLGKVFIDVGYVVDLENEEMVQHAMDAIYEDVMNMVKYNELHNAIEVKDVDDANEGDIPEFLTEETEDWVE